MLLSVCIPTFNRCGYLRLSVRYWLEQMAPFAGRVELIVADNASTDDTIAVLESHRNVEALRVVRRPLNLGFNASTYDLVVNQAAGEYIWVCGDDDYLNPGGLAEIVSAIETHRHEEHFYVTTQFIPSDCALDIAVEDPRDSPHVRGPQGDRSSRRVSRTGEILKFDGGGFSGFYSSIWKRPLAVEALSGEFCRRDPFKSLEATLPYAVFIARHRLEKPCHCIGRPILTVAHTVSWPQYASLFRLRMMPDLYDLYQKNGVPEASLKRYRLELLDHWPLLFVDLVRRRRDLSVPGSFFTGYVLRRLLVPRFWKELFRALWCDLLP
jgi:glycosyltransferase involved in cell wall biosynthesis